MKSPHKRNKTSPSALIIAVGALLPGIAAAQTFLINATTNNGSFELLGPVPGAANAAKATNWDTDPDGDVTYWTQFPGVGVQGDSGTETGASTNGTKRAFLQNGNAVYNMTTHVIQAGDKFTFAWDAINTPAHNVSLVYDNGGTLVALGTPVASTTIGNGKTGSYIVALGDPAVGHTVGLKIASTGNYPAIDNVLLSFVFTDPDTDGDTLFDLYEDKYFGNNDGIVTPSDLSPQNGSGDPDGDTLSNATEFNLSKTDPTLADTDGDTLSDAAEYNGTSNAFAPGTKTNPLLKDSDGDRVSDAEENGSLNKYPLPGGGGATNPNDPDTDFDGVNDYEELAYHSNPNDFDSRPTPTLHNLVDNTLQNGSFELRNGILNTAKTTHWDAIVGDTNDIDNWTEWLPAIGGISTNPTDSGVEGGGTNGPMRGYLRGGDAIYNLSNSSAGEGSVYACTWKQVSAAGNVLTARLVYQDGSFIRPINDSLATTSTGTVATPGLGRILYRVPAGSPAIGKQIGVAFSSGGSWIGFDEVVLNIADGDSDHDGLGDFDEDHFFGNNDGIPTLAELALQSGTSDADGDGLNNNSEINVFHTFPKVKDSDGDGLEDGPEVAELLTVEVGVIPSNLYNGRATDPLLTDSDHDGITDFEENGSLNVAFSNQPTDPNATDTDSDGISDRNEVYYGSNPNDDTSVPNPVLYSLINNYLLNGSFELQGGVASTVKQVQWDNPAGDVDNWKLWTELSSASTDSGVEPGGSHGAMRAFLQGGNAVYNMTSEVAAAGAVYACSWKHTGNDGTIDVQLVYNDGGVIKSLAASSAVTTNAAQTGDLVYRIPAGSPAIGKTIGIGVRNVTAGYPQVDEFSLSVVSPDTDGDGLADRWETDNFGAGNLSQGPGGDPDGDGYTNLQEQAAHSNPNDATSNPGDGDRDGLADAWETEKFGNLAQTGAGDFDSDGSTNQTEFRLGLDPVSGSSFFVAAVGSGGAIQWPSATGVTFKIQRSTTLGADWVTLEAAFPGTAGTASYTDPSPPAGKAFYKIELNP
ncbi:hypothetical protein [Luteolibacter soli]|uniref:Uncharacterized protein n=1 Tax=Luteolibacter soli TaxID=3135280 RepID=A0ABU9AZM5_9BACT